MYACLSCKPPQSLLFRELWSSSSGLPLKDYRKENVLPKIEIPVCWAWRLCSCVPSGRGLLGKCFNSLALEQLFTCRCKISTRKTFSWSLWIQVAETGTDKYSRRSVLSPCSLPRMPWQMIIRHNYRPGTGTRGTWPCTGMRPSSLYASKAVRVYYRQLQWLHIFSSSFFFFPVTHPLERLFVKKSDASVVCSLNLMFPGRMARKGKKPLCLLEG